MKRAWLVIYGLQVAIAAEECLALPQEPFVLPGRTEPTAVAFETTPDTLSQPVAAAQPDSATKRLRFNIDAGYHTPPVHPYFRNEYRLIQDMRRLVLFVDRRKIHGYESVADLFALARKFPESKQTEIIRAAVAGSVANFASEMASKRMREKKIRFVQWELEKVVFRSAIRSLSLNLFNGVTARGFGAHLPALRLSYARHSTPYEVNESITCWPLRRLGLNYTRNNGRPIITPIIVSPFGTAAISYDRDLKVITSGFEFRKKSNIIIRLMHVNPLHVPKADYMRSEVLLRW